MCEDMNTEYARTLGCVYIYACMSVCSLLTPHTVAVKGRPIYLQ